MPQISDESGRAVPPLVKGGNTLSQTNNKYGGTALPPFGGGSDSHYNGNNWICPDLVSTNNGISNGMGANALVGNAPNSTANGTSTNMTIDANLTGNAPNSSNNSFSVNMSFDDRETDVPS